MSLLETCGINHIDICFCNEEASYCPLCKIIKEKEELEEQLSEIEKFDQSH